MYLAVSRTPGSVEVAVSRNLPVLTSANTPDEDVLGIRSLYFERCANATQPQTHRIGAVLEPTITTLREAVTVATLAAISVTNHIKSRIENRIILLLSPH